MALAQRTGVKLAMIGHHELGERLVATQNDVTAVLALDLECLRVVGTWRTAQVIGTRLVPRCADVAAAVRWRAP